MSVVSQNLQAEPALAGKHVLVVGGTSGIGRAAAEKALAAGASVTVASRDPQRADGTFSAPVRTEHVDISDTASVEALFNRVGAFDHLVLSAGPGAMGSVRDLSSADARPFMDIKFWGYYDAVRAASGAIAQDGSITMVGGGASRKHAPGRPVMAAVNAALEAFGKANALDLAPIRVNVIAPGLVDTPAYSGMPEEMRQGMYAGYGNAVPAGRVGKAEDVASAALFLMTNTFVTGTVIDVDGGVHVS
ncbi:SDR family oxidoreductase [Arthrobacter oryzae]|uniref:NAD(P)-dependent dehydrogenase (Short-subunit alcohol dehydrogenase family) n=1 Tax=Arthrobacter oryzae TaxID=409290 RepID=A0A495FMK2_9MICC|nr:SDR family oxidoreductase [Arthrobacter oryzae]RKR29967.1 NAD(P)-dependent dehydrogenase (short-subunit alcohol dehydrogenase family) [Arthrobacter oryzae]